MKAKTVVSLEQAQREPKKRYIMLLIHEICSSMSASPWVRLHGCVSMESLPSIAIHRWVSIDGEVLTKLIVLTIIGSLSLLTTH